MLDLLETFLVYVYSSLQRFWPSVVFFIISFMQYYVNLSILNCNADEINLYALYSVTYEVQLICISFNTICPE